MSKNTNDPLDPKMPGELPPPISPELQPELILPEDQPEPAPSEKAAESSSKESPAPSQPDRTQESQDPPKKGKGTHVGIISAMAAVIVVLSAVVVLFATGVIGGTKETKNTKSAKSNKATIPPTDATWEDPDYETPDSLSVETDPPAPHLFVEFAADVSDEQLTELQEFAENCFKTDEVDRMPPAVTLELFNYVGMIISHWDGDSQHGIVWLFYQVQLADQTGPQPVHRNYFWRIGFSQVYKDGYLDTSIQYIPDGTLYFDDWSTSGLISVDAFRMDLKRDGNVISDDTVVSTNFLPLPGRGVYVQQDRVGVTSADQISPAQLAALKAAAPECYHTVGGLTNGTLDEMRYLGTLVASGEEETQVFLAYEIEISSEDMSGITFYWYVGFPYVYQGGELDVRVYNTPTCWVSSHTWSSCGVSSIDELVNLITSYPNYFFYEVRIGEEAAADTDADGFIFPKSDKEEIPDEKITELTSEEIRMAINEIWARHGYIFRNEDILEYYRQFGWYKEKVPADEWDANGQDMYLNDVEMKNIQKLVEEREKRA